MICKYQKYERKKRDRDVDEVKRQMGENMCYHMIRDSYTLERKFTH